MARDMIEAEVSTGDNLSPTEVRERWIAGLRRQGHRQCTGDLFDFRGGVCAIGLLAEVAGLWRAEAEDMWVFDIGEHAGLSREQSEEVWRRNDGAAIDGGGDIMPIGPRYHQHTFAEIADVVEGWFK